MAKLDKSSISDIFRLSTVLYAEDNYNISPVQIQKKLIENALLDINRDDYVNTLELSQYINDKYQITILAEEIWKIVSTPKYNDTVFHCYKQDSDNSLVCLTKERKEKIATSKVMHIDDYINQYIEEYQLPKDKMKDLIYKFLFGVFTLNTENFKRLIDNNALEQCDADSIYDDEERDVINGFLNWNNPEKNKAIFNVASFALEYCMLTNTNNTSITIESLRNKVFYLDTNIIFRALGINGNLRKSRTISILKKFQQVGETLWISKVTLDEFNNSINHHINIIKKYDNPNIQADIFLEEVGANKEFYCFYQQWKRNKRTQSISMFKAEIETLFEDFIKQFKIEVERFSPYDKSSEEYNKKLCDYTSEIHSYKRTNYESKARHDAQNILWLEHKRNIQPQNIFEAKYFLLSSDHRLQKWDYSRSNQVPIVFLPSQWLSISLRFLERTNDDFSSFVSFLNLSYHERLMDNDKMLAVLSGISEYASGYDNQKRVLHKFIEIRTSKAITEWNEDDLYSNARDFAKSEIENQLDDTQKALENERMKSKNTIDEHHKELVEQKAKTDSLKAELEETKKKELETTKELNEVKNILSSIEQRRRIRNNWLWFILYTIILLLLIFIVFLTFFLQDWKYNYIAKLIVYIECLNSTQQEWANAIVLGISSIAFCAIGKKWLNKLNSIRN